MNKKGIVNLLIAFEQQSRKDGVDGLFKREPDPDPDPINDAIDRFYDRLKYCKPNKSTKTIQNMFSEFKRAIFLACGEVCLLCRAAPDPGGGFHLVARPRQHPCFAPVCHTCLVKHSLNPISCGEILRSAKLEEAWSHKDSPWESEG